MHAIIHICGAGASDRACRSAARQWTHLIDAAGAVVFKEWAWCSAPIHRYPLERRNWIGRKEQARRLTDIFVPCVSCALETAPPFLFLRVREVFQILPNEPDFSGCRVNELVTAQVAVFVARGFDWPFGMFMALIVSEYFEKRFSFVASTGFNGCAEFISGHFKDQGNTPLGGLRRCTSVMCL